MSGCVGECDTCATCIVWRPEGWGDPVGSCETLSGDGLAASARVTTSTTRAGGQRRTQTCLWGGPGTGTAAVYRRLRALCLSSHPRVLWPESGWSRDRSVLYHGRE